MGIADRKKTNLSYLFPYIKAWGKKIGMTDAEITWDCRTAKIEGAKPDAYRREPKFGKGVWLLATGELKRELDEILKRK